MFTAGAAGATTVEPVLDTVWLVSCASEVETKNEVDTEFASVDIAGTLVGYTADNLFALSARRTREVPAAAADAAAAERCCCKGLPARMFITGAGGHCLSRKVPAKEGI